MQIPSEDEIQAATDQLKDADYWKGNESVLVDQAKELVSALPHASNDFRAGYELGVQTARVMVSMSMAAIQAKVSI